MVFWGPSVSSYERKSLFCWDIPVLKPIKNCAKAKKTNSGLKYYQVCKELHDIGWHLLDKTHFSNKFSGTYIMQDSK
jgi:hypothetical protein